jgi:hypothetical protein
VAVRPDFVPFTRHPMTIHQDYSLVRYDPDQRALAYRTDGRLRPATAPVPPPARRRAGAPAAGLPRPNPVQAVYSPRLTLAAAADKVTGRVVDIFV